MLLISASIISFLEFNGLIKKIWKKEKDKIYLMNILSFCYLGFFAYAGYDLAYFTEDILYVLLVCIFSDIGGYVVGKNIGGKRLTKISPKKTISGSIGSFIFSFIIMFIFVSIYSETINISIIKLGLITILLSLVCQVGDIFISFFKRKAKVKDTGTLLPGHGGLLDRIDGIIFTVPFFFIIEMIVL
tara:strand:+ start:52 stop:612 length:561 start_codon:yes stop_codon:yes gene_type:complete